MKIFGSTDSAATPEDASTRPVSLLATAPVAAVAAAGLLFAPTTSVAGTAPQPIRSFVWTTGAPPQHRANDASMQLLTKPVRQPLAVANSNESDVPLDSKSTVEWLHENSGLTWDQIARALGVSRRSVHLWASGGRVSSRNAEHLASMYAAVREVDAPHARARRDALLAHRSGRMSIYDEIASSNRSPMVQTATPVARNLGVDSA